MSFDQTTESIAHFVGLFHLSIEELRLRDDYLEFKAAELPKEEDTRFEFTPVKLSAPYRLADYDPKLRYSEKPPVLTAEGAGQAPALPPPQPGQVGASSVDVPQGPGAFVSGLGGGGDSQTIVVPFVPIPPSVIVVTLQSIVLYDNDVIGDPDAAGFEALEVLISAFQAVTVFAQALQPWTSAGLAEAVLDASDAAVEFLMSLEDVEVSSFPNAVFVRGPEAETTLVNGEKVEEFPDIQSNLPEFIRNKRGDEEEDDGPQLAGETKDPVGLFDSQTGFHQTFANSGHNVIAGVNETHNIVDIKTSWIDAQVFAVAGDVVNLNAISQNNILQDIDTVNGQINGNSAFASQALNMAAMDLGTPEEELSEISVVDDADEGAEPLILPSIWNLERYEGDVVVANIVEQYTFATDFDRLDLSIEANSTIISSGENLMFNEYLVGQFGYGYDLIAIGGSMTTMNLIQQTNVLLDNDRFTGDGLGAASISGNDNLLLNVAEITQTGHDEQVDMAQEFRDALRDLSTGVAELAREVAQSTLFEGNETLRALYIEGDLVQMNIVDQINYLGDSDQIRLQSENILSVLDDMPISITAGSNLMSNTASIEQEGYDSIVMAEGTHYEDAMLYQTGLIDTDAHPLGVNIAALASEAVAFLAEDMVAEALESAYEDHPHLADLHSGGTSLDVMQTLTA